MDDSKAKSQQSQQIQPTPNQVPPQPTPGMPYQMPPKKKMSKGALWGIIGGSIGLIILIVGIVLAVIFLGGPSKADYKDLISQINDFNSDALREVKSSSNGGNLQDGINKSIERTDEQHKKIESHKALRDKELKDVYDKYNNTWKNDTKPYFQYLALIAGKRSEFSNKCQRRNKIKFMDKTKAEIEQSFDSVMKECIELVDETSNSDNKFAAEYGNNLKNYFAEVKQFYVKLAEYNKTGKLSLRPDVPKPPIVNGKENLVRDLRNNYNDFKKLLEKKANG